VGQTSTISAHAERRAMIAVIAVFALLVQAMLPSLATAGPMPTGAQVICTEMGLQTTPADPATPPLSHACKHCLCPAPADTPPPVVVVARVAYVVAVTAQRSNLQRRLPPARAPPRPPGQGPPLPTA
jgi:hypothetical protein